MRILILLLAMMGQQGTTHATGIDGKPFVCPSNAICNCYAGFTKCEIYQMPVRPVPAHPDGWHHEHHEAYDSFSMQVEPCKDCAVGTLQLANGLICTKGKPGSCLEGTKNGVPCDVNTCDYPPGTSGLVGTYEPSQIPASPKEAPQDVPNILDVDKWLGKWVEANCQIERYYENTAYIGIPQYGWKVEGELRIRCDKGNESRK